MARLGPHPAPKIQPRLKGQVNSKQAEPLLSNASLTQGISSSSRPPVINAWLVIINSILPFLLLWLSGTEEALPSHFVATGLGMFVSVGLLGLFRQRLNQARSSGSFLDWRVSSSRIVLFFTSVAWLVGAINLFIICYDLSRNFTA
jgi:hypothetical protein